MTCQARGAAVKERKELKEGLVERAFFVALVFFGGKQSGSNHRPPSGDSVRNVDLAGSEFSTQAWLLRLPWFGFLAPERR